MPRLKNIGSAKLYRPAAGQDDNWPNLGPVLSTKTIDWDLIAQQYDQIVKYTTALRLGTAEAEQVLRRFTRGGPKHPTYRAIEDRRALSPLFWTHVNPYGRFELDMNSRLDLDLTARAARPRREGRRGPPCGRAGLSSRAARARFELVLTGGRGACGAAAQLSRSVGSAARERVAARLARSLRRSSEVLPGSAV
jgi:hypothetical protein